MSSINRSKRTKINVLAKVKRLKRQKEIRLIWLSDWHCLLSSTRTRWVLFAVRMGVLFLADEPSHSPTQPVKQSAGGGCRATKANMQCQTIRVSECQNALTATKAS